MIELVIEQIESLERGYRLHWSVDDKKNLFRVSPLEISYEFTPSPVSIYPVNNLLAFALPILAKEYGDVKIVSDFDLDERIKDYWNRLLQALNIENFHLDWKSNGRAESLNVPPEKGRLMQGRTALLFGGGVESTFALSVLYPYKPVLISIVGERWMNNDIQNYSIKQQLEDDLISEFDLEFQRVTSNAFSLINKPDLYKNYYVTGLLFYWHSVPVCREFGIQNLYKSSEMEEALNFDYQDLSLHPSFLKYVIMDDEPLFLPLFNCYPKIRMLEELAKTPFLRYIYSCYHNTNRRWCGKCTKCYRISEFCDRLGIDRNLIGMQEGIVGLRETGSISQHYWRYMDILYGRRRAREISHAFKYHRKKAKDIIRYYRKRVRGAVAKCIRRLLPQRGDSLITILKRLMRKSSEVNKLRKPTFSLTTLGLKLPKTLQATDTKSSGSGDEVLIIAGGDVCFDRQLRATPPVVSYGHRLSIGQNQRNDSTLEQYNGLPLLNLPNAHGRRAFIDSYDRNALRIDLPPMDDDKIQDYPFMHLRDIFSAADVAFVNLETPLGKGLRVTGMFLSSPIFAQTLVDAGVSIVSLANNHSFDAGEAGLLSTLRLLEGVGIKVFGAGNNLTEAKRPAVTVVRGQRIAWIGCTQKCNMGFQCSAATEDRPGILPMDPQVIIDEIATARKVSNLVIVCPHWSIGESMREPEPLLVDCAHLFIDAGADVILGTGPHVVQPIELYKGKPIVYCMGNLIFGHGQRNWYDNILVQLCIKNNQLESLEILPISGCNSELFKPKVLTAPRATEVLQEIKLLCDSVHTSMDIRGHRGIINIPS